MLHGKTSCRYPESSTQNVVLDICHSSLCLMCMYGRERRGVDDATPSLEHGQPCALLSFVSLASPSTFCF